MLAEVESEWDHSPGNKAGLSTQLRVHGGSRVRCGRGDTE